MTATSPLYYHPSSYGSLPPQPMIVFVPILLMPEEFSSIADKSGDSPLESSAQDITPSDTTTSELDAGEFDDTPSDTTTSELDAAEFNDTSPAALESPVADSTVSVSEVVFNQLRSKGWDFSTLVHSTPTFNDPISLCTTSHSPSIAPNGMGRHPSWMLNYPALSFLLSGKYYSDYNSVISLMGLPNMTRQLGLVPHSTKVTVLAH